MTHLIVPPVDAELWPTLGPQLCEFIEERFVFGPGPLNGQPYVLSPEKRALVYKAYEINPVRHKLPGRRRFKRAAWSVRKGLAKALALDTPIATPSGWSTMGELQPGDTVFDERGQQVKVVGTSAVFLGNDCYRVTFKDGSSIVADADHRWYTEELRRQRDEDGVLRMYVGSVKTTAEISQTVVLRPDGARNHRIPVAGPLNTAEADLPIDPWILGAWLGDGRNDDAEFTMHPADYPHFIAQVEAAGYFHKPPKIDTRTEAGVYAVRVSSTPITNGGDVRRDSLKGRLRDEGLLGDKHVPDAYLRASLAQRLRLLQGLMDTDGTIDASGSAAVFTSTVQVIADGVYELLCSVGLKPTVKPFTTTAGTPAWKVYVFADSATPIFSLPRKYTRQRPATSRTAMSSNRHIVSVEQVHSVPTRCIAVDSDSHLFLAGKAMVPTHNTEWGAIIVACELHPEAPVRCDGFDGYGEPVGRPVASPYIPMLSYSKDQTEELAYGALVAILKECDDAEMFDIGLERIIRLDHRGRADGSAVPLAGSPNARDGARTTFQLFDEPHRLYTPRLHEAHNTMSANLPKRPDADAWSLYVGTAGELGQNSIQEDLHHEARDMASGKIKSDPRIFYFHRDAGKCHRGKDPKAEGHNLSTKRGRLDAIREATGPDGEYGPGQFEDISEQWTRPKADLAYLERVWLNLWIPGDKQAFDLDDLDRGHPTIQLGSLVTAGFDGARFKDSTAIVITDVFSGVQQLYAIWERPLGVEEWEVNPTEVSDAVDMLMLSYDVWRWNGDPAHYTEEHANWSGRYPQVEEWWTQSPRKMAFAVKDYQDAIRAREVRFATDLTPALNSPVKGETMSDALVRHIGNAGKRMVNVYDAGDENAEGEVAEHSRRGRQLFTLEKLHETRKFDGCMAAILSWQGRLDALRDEKLHAPRRSTAVKRLR